LAGDSLSWIEKQHLPTHVESSFVACLDGGSTPPGSTSKVDLTS